MLSPRIGLPLLLLLACCNSERPRKSREEDSSEESEEAPRKKPRKADSAKGPVVHFDQPQVPSVRPQLSFEPVAPQAPAVAPEFDFFGSASTRIPAALAERPAPLRLTEVAVRSERVIVEYVAPDGKAVRAFTLSGEATREDKPPLIQPDVSKLAELSFSSADVDWAKLPAMAKTARERVADSEGISHGVIQRFLPFHQDVQVRIFVLPGGYADFTARGGFLAAHAK